MPLRDNPACTEPSTRPPWYGYGLVSWWDMEEFSARAFYQIGKLIEKVRVDYSNSMRLDDASRLNPEGIVALQRFATEIKKHCAGLGLELVVRRLDEIIRHSNVLTYAQAANELEQVDREIRWEMESHQFLFLSPKEAELYAQKKTLFGDEVSKNFLSAVFDIQEAGKSLALARPTACVFHLMRVLEIGLTVLGGVFGVSLAHTNWAPALDEIESKIREMHKDPKWKAMADCKEQQEFYAQAATHFGVLKDAWRNYTMHARGKYTEEEAKQMLENVRMFMQKLATRLHE